MITVFCPIHTVGNKCILCDNFVSNYNFSNYTSYTCIRLFRDNISPSNHSLKYEFFVWTFQNRTKVLELGKLIIKIVRPQKFLENEKFNNLQA